MIHFDMPGHGRSWCLCVVSSMACHGTPITQTVLAHLVPVCSHCCCILMLQATACMNLQSYKTGMLS